VGPGWYLECDQREPPVSFLAALATVLDIGCDVTLGLCVTLCKQIGVGFLGDLSSLAPHSFPVSGRYRILHDV